MKHLLAIIFAVTLLRSNAQTFYIKAGGGYAFPQPSDQLGYNRADIDKLMTDPETGYYEIEEIISRDGEVRGTYNSGVVSTISTGYLFPSNIGVELNAGYVFGNEYIFSNESSEYLDGELLHQRYTTNQWRAKNIYVSPAVLITTDERQMRPYVTAGLLLSIPTMKESQERYSNYDSDAGRIIMKNVYTRGLSLGFRGAAGLDFKLKESLYLFAEIAFTSLTYNPKQRETVLYEMNGQDFLPTLSQRQRIIDLVPTKEVSYPNGFSSRGTEVRPSFDFSSIASMAGLKFQL